MTEMAEQSIKSRSVKGTLWSFVDNISTMFCSFIIGVVLARLLSPTDYGTVGVLSIFLSLANVFIDCGFSNALIRKKDRSQADLSTAFYFNVIVSVFVYIILFLLAPVISDFFSIPILVDLLRVLGLMIIFNGLSIVQTAQFTANLKIKTITYVNLFSLIPMGVVGIYFAYKGFGVWTLVIQQVGGAFLRTLLLWILSKWKPSFTFDIDSFHYLFGFGWKLLGANLIGTFFNEVYGFIIGRFMGSTSLGFYSKAKLLAEKPKTVIQNVVNRVVLPIMVETQGDINRIRSVYSRLIQLTSFISFPLHFLLALIAQPLIIILWTDKWVDSILLFQLFCVGFSWGPIGQLNFSLLELLDRTDLTLKLEFVKKPLLILLLVVGIPYGVKGVVLGASMYNIFGTIINMYPTKTLLNYSYFSQFKDIATYLIVSVFSFVLSYCICSFINNNCIYIVFGCLIYSITFVFLCFLFKLSALKEILSLVRKQ